MTGRAAGGTVDIRHKNRPAVKETPISTAVAAIHGHPSYSW
jgi:hypothetical protein